MTEQINKYQMLLSPEQINELTAIYEDYMYEVRQFEKVLQTSSVSHLAKFQMQLLYKEEKPNLPWKVEFLRPAERAEFQRFADDNSPEIFKKSYISLQHTNPTQDHVKPFEDVPDGYDMYMVDMRLPSPVERYTIAYPENATIGNTKFLVDGLYKATYLNTEDADMSVSDIFDNPKIQAEFRILVNLIDKYREHNCQAADKYPNWVINLYAAETTASWENTILEILGSFAIKVQDLCRHIYGSKKEDHALERAEQDHLIPSATDFKDYINIRHLIRHQWDTMDKFGYFQKSLEIINQRAEFIQSYLKLCDKTIVQRQKAYIDVLHQMQYVINKIAPEQLIRNQFESNTKFIKRLKTHQYSNPDKDIFVELNYPMASEKYKTLYKNLHKIFPRIKIKEEFINDQNALRQLDEDYSRRSWFLMTYHVLECRMMAYCFLRGEDLRNRDAWKHFHTHNLISPQEYNIWYNYTLLRNDLSHNFYSPALRQKLRDVEKEYLKHINTLENRICSVWPTRKKLKHNLHQMIHKDGLCVTIDYDNKKISCNIQRPSVPKPKFLGKIDLTDPKYASRNKRQLTTETYPNDIEITTSNEKIISFKTPNGICINLEKQRISWPTDVQLHTNAEKFNIIQAGNHKLTTNKDFRVTSFFEGTHSLPIHSGDVCMMGGKHRAFIGDLEYLNAFHYKNSDGNLIKAQIRQSDTGTQIALNDGTKILLHGTDLIVAHKGKVLTYDNRQEFAATYNDAPFIPPQTVKRGNER